MSELRVHFHREMDEISLRVSQIFSLLAEDLATATDAFLAGDPALASVIVEREVEIDGLQKTIEELACSHIALQAPVARDLRFLINTIRIVPELERSHDLVVHIARHVDGALSNELSPKARGLVQQMGSIGVEMWTRAGGLWMEREIGGADWLDERDDVLDTLHVALEDVLAGGQLGIRTVMAMTLVARFYERLGDHAVNIARRIASTL
jgi:phosphate transport system protein